METTKEWSVGDDVRVRYFGNEFDVEVVSKEREGGRWVYGLSSGGDVRFMSQSSIVGPATGAPAFRPSAR